MSERYFAYIHMLGIDHEFCDHCPGCRPALIDMRTGEVFAEDSAVMTAVKRVWNGSTSYAERKAFIAVTLHNSRATTDIELALRVTEKIKHALAGVKTP